jgi:hypothetical protein
LMIIAPSSMMFPAPMTIGPVMAKIVTLGCTIVPRGGTDRIKIRIVRDIRLRH